MKSKSWKRGLDCWKPGTDKQIKQKLAELQRWKEGLFCCYAHCITCNHFVDDMRWSEDDRDKRLSNVTAVMYNTAATQRHGQC